MDPLRLRRCAARAVLLLLALAIAACGGPAGPIDGDRALAHVRQLVAIGPRPFGSDGLAKAADYITGELQKLGLSPQRHEVVDEKEKKTIRNLYVQIDGDDPKNGPILMFGAHYDTKLTHGHGNDDHNFPFVGAIDGGGAPAVLLELARALKERTPKPKVNVWLYWIDAEESIDFHWNDDRALLGSKAFVKWLDETKVRPRVKAFVLLDLLGDRDWKIDKDNQSNEALQQIFANAARALGIGDRVYKYQSGATDDHIVFRNRGIPSVLLIDFEFRRPMHLRSEEEKKRPPHPDDERYAKWWHTPQDTLDRMSPEALAWPGNLVVQAFADLEAFCLKK